MSLGASGREREVARVDRLWRRDDGPPLLVSFYLAEVDGCIRCIGYAVRTFLASTVHGDGGPGDYWDTWVPPEWFRPGGAPPDFGDVLEGMDAERPALAANAYDQEGFAIEEMGDPFQVNATLARSLPFGDLLERAVRDYAKQWRMTGRLLENFGGRKVTYSSEDGSTNTLDFPGSPEEGRLLIQLADTVEQAPRARQAHDAGETVTLERIARLYETRCRLGSSTPTRDVAEELNMSRSTTAKKIMRCRDAGLLEPTSRGRAGGLPAPEREERS